MNPLQLPNAPAPQRVSVVVVGAGPAGLTVANILRHAGVDCVVLETETREFIEQRQRAGVLEEWAVRALEERGLAGDRLRTAQRHTACEFRFDGGQHRFEYSEVTGRHHFIYPQPLLVADLVRAYADV
ncbi:FAD-dependent monooxygenase, partial [Streptomyces sp. A475]